jgi:predicted CXXCH cytochrome family protein
VELTGWSLLCLGCHDGVTATDVYASAHAVTLTGQLANSRLGSTGLRGHPVGIRYPVAQEGYHTRAAVEARGLSLPQGRIQCTTCHDAHNTHHHSGMLRISNSRSRLCLTCHRL